MIISPIKLHYSLCILGIVLCGGLFSACDMLGGIYDDTLDGSSSENSSTDGNKNSSEEKSSTDEDGETVTIKVISGSFYKDCTSYTQWVYVNMHGDEPVFTTSTIDIDDKTESGVPEEWDFALHRYDVKTNGASVLMTTYHSIDELEAARLPTDGTWVEDTYSETSVTIDMSHMLEGYLIYAPGKKNTEAGKWLDVDTSSMPPNYTMRDNVLLYRFSDGTYAAIQLSDFMSDDRYRIKGWMTVVYKYPVFK